MREGKVCSIHHCIPSLAQHLAHRCWMNKAILLLYLRAYVLFLECHFMCADFCLCTDTDIFFSECSISKLVLLSLAMWFCMLPGHQLSLQSAMITFVLIKLPVFSPHGQIKQFYQTFLPDIILIPFLEILSCFNYICKFHLKIYIYMCS